MTEKENRRRACALRRLSLAVDRVIRGENPEAAKRWAAVWGKRAGVVPSAPAGRPVSLSSKKNGHGLD